MIHKIYPVVVDSFVVVLGASADTRYTSGYVAAIVFVAEVSFLASGSS